MSKQIRCQVNYTLITARKRSYGKVIFLHLSISYSVHQWGVCLWSEGEGLPHPGQTPPYPVHAGIHTPHCPVHAGIHPPRPVHSGIHNPPYPVHGIQSTSGRYASHWNALLFMFSVPVYYCVHSLCCLYCGLMFVP